MSTHYLNIITRNIAELEDILQHNNEIDTTLNTVLNSIRGMQDYYTKFLEGSDSSKNPKEHQILSRISKAKVLLAKGKNQLRLYKSKNENKFLNGFQTATKEALKNLDEVKVFLD